MPPEMEVIQNSQAGAVTEPESRGQPGQVNSGGAELGHRQLLRSRRQRPGQYSFINTGITDVACAMNALAGAAELAGGQAARPAGMLNGGSFYDYYHTSDVRWLSVGGLEPQLEARLRDALV